jgi:hypothetical protein
MGGEGRVKRHVKSFFFYGTGEGVVGRMLWSFLVPRLTRENA